jgi:ABC-type polysaccharide/polyol phosphate transport system ATPase subunit
MSAKIKVTNISFRRPVRNYYSYIENIINFFTKRLIYKSILSDINFEFSTGDKVAIIGDNGSGKTSLLRILSKIYIPNSGSVSNNAKTLPIMDLGSLFFYELTAHENILFICSLYKVSHAQSLKILHDVKEFSGLSESFYQQLNTFSLGMIQRLSYSLGLYLDSEILIIDELLIGGDASFNKKFTKALLGKFLKTSIVIITSHDQNLIQKICNKGVVLRGGKIEFNGDISEAIKVYNKKNS